jgi:hypothetical protein
MRTCRLCLLCESLSTSGQLSSVPACEGLSCDVSAHSFDCLTHHLCLRACTQDGGPETCVVTFCKAL